MVTAEVLALTTSALRQLATSTPRVARCTVAASNLVSSTSRGFSITSLAV